MAALQTTPCHAALTKRTPATVVSDFCASSGYVLSLRSWGDSFSFGPPSYPSSRFANSYRAVEHALCPDHTCFHWLYWADGMVNPSLSQLLHFFVSFRPSDFATAAASNVHVSGRNRTGFADRSVDSCFICSFGLFIPSLPSPASRTCTRTVRPSSYTRQKLDPSVTFYVK